MKVAHLIRQSKTAMRFWITCIVLLAIPFSAAITTSVRTRNTVIDISVENARACLEQNAEVVSTYLSHAIKTVSVIGMDEALVLISNSSMMKRNQVYYHSIKLLNSLNSFRINNDFYTEIFVMLDDYDYIVATTTIYTTNRFYNTFFTYGSMSHGEWQAHMIQNNKGRFLPATSIQYNGVTSRVIPYICALMPTSRSEESNYIILLLDEAKISRLLTGIDIGSEGYVYMADAEGTIIASVKGEKATAVTPIEHAKGLYHQVNGRDMIVTSQVSGSNGWQYVSVVPKDYILRDVASQFQQTLLLLGLALLLSFGLSFMFTTINMRPLREVVGTIMGTLKTGSPAEQNEYELIKHHVRDITRKNSLLQSKLDALQPMMHSTVFESLISGAYFHDHDIYEALRYIDLDLNDLKHTIVVIKITYYPDTFKSHDQAMVAVGETVVEDSQYLHYGDRKLILLCADKTSESLKMRMDVAARQAVKRLREQHDIDVVFGLGNIYSDAANLSKSYKEALQVIDYLYLGRTVIWYYELPQTSGLYYFPANMKNSLFSAASNSRFEEVERIVRRLYYENFVNRKLTPQMCRQLLNELYCTAYSVIESDAACLSDLITPPYEKNIEDEFEDIITLFEKICQETFERRSRYKTELIGKITAYIETEFKNESISLASVAECFGLSETYLSHLFKDETGDNFSKYIERKRIKLACSLIGKMQIKDIAQEIGYNNVMTFSRAFRRVNGCNPSDYAKSIPT